MNLDKLKEAARKFEQREEWRRAIDVYLKAIREAEDAGGEGTQDPALYNRVGDLEMKAGDSLASLRAYEQAAELYADQGFFNNAIALCGKILRVNPSRTATYLRLAQLHARKNFVGEAKKNLIEYLDRMNGVGQLEEAFSAVKLFADQFHANPDIRLMLVELLRASSRTEEAKEQLEKLASELEARGDATGARRTRERLHAIAEERPQGGRRGPNDLVFLDTGDHVASKPVAPLEGLVANASEELVAEPANLAIDVTEHGAGALDATVAAGDELLDAGAVEASDPDWAADVSQMEGLDLITADGVGGEEDTGTGDELPLLDVDESAMPMGGDYAEGDSTVWLVEEGPGAATLSGDSEADLEATEFDDVAASEPARGDPGQPPPSRADTMYLQLEDMMSAADPFGGVEPGVALLERAREALDNGEREQGIAALEEALRFFESESRWDEALRACSDLLHLDPGEIGRYQKQVEVAYRAGQRPLLVQAYLELADALVRMDAVDHATHVYQRVLEHDPGNEQARSALELLESMADLGVVMPPLPKAEPEAPRPAPAAQTSAPAPLPPAPVPAPAPAPSGGEFVDLGALILDEQQVRDTRMRIGQSQPIEDEDQAFHEALAEFKRGIDANLEANDFQAHYDLGIAFKEMGLLDEAIAQFQKALRSPDGRLRTSEQLGAAFYAKGQYAICEAVLRRAVDGLPGADDEKIGLLYWLGRALEAQQRGRDALPLYERALAVDIRFLDLGERVQRLGAEPAR
ncbi:MAG TPA: tetratricopeptide repeat protein [Gemmatimonadales bacterium]|nr:tetratricopeptide repeat protein [Gemmatimonadales bacterium]